MSLLLKALKQAEAANADRSDTAIQNEGDFGQVPLAVPGSIQAREWVEPPGVLFGSSGLTPEPARAPAFRWPQLSLVPVASLLAALIALGYGLYLYFALQPPAVVHPIAYAAAPVAPAAAAADPVAVDPTPAVLPAPALPQSSAPASARPVPVPLATPTRPAIKPSSRTAPPPTTPPLFQPDTQTALLSQAYTAYQRGALAEAQRLYAEAAARERSVDALLGLAAIASVQNRDTDAQHLYREVLDLDPRNATAQGALLDLLGNTDSRATESRLKTLIERDPSPQLYQTLGNLYASEARWREAQTAYFEAWRNMPGNADYAYNLAVSLDQLRQYAAALTYYEKALAAGGIHRFDRAQAEARMQQLKSAR